MSTAPTTSPARASGRAGTTGAEVLVKQLENYGVEVIFGLCGHTNITVLDALSRSRIDFITART